MHCPQSRQRVGDLRRAEIAAVIDQIDRMHAVAGMLVGVLVGLTGVGGGSLMTPLLVLMFGVNPKTAVGTDLLFAAITKTVGSTVHGWRDTVDWHIFRRLAAGSIPAALLSVVALQGVGEIGARAEHVIIDFLGKCWTMIYDPRGQVAETVNPLDEHTVYYCDLLNRVIAMVDLLGNRTSYIYDLNGRLQETKSFFGFVS